MSLALLGRFLTTGPPGKSPDPILIASQSCFMDTVLHEIFRGYYQRLLFLIYFLQSEFGPLFDGHFCSYFVIILFHISGFPQCQVILFYLFVFKNVTKSIMIMCFVYRRKVYTLIITFCFKGSRLGASHQLGALKQGKKVLLLGSSSLLLPDGSDGKESACNARDLALILESRRSPGEGNGNPFQYSCLENSMDRGTWRATVHGVSKSRT